MADNNDFAVHDVKVTQQTRFSPTGDAVRVSLVTYWVGTHGPFQLEYAAGAGSSDQIKQDISSQVAELRRLMQIEGASY